MADDVKVREIRLLEAYSKTYGGFMESSISMSYRFRSIIQQKDDEARDMKHKIEDHLNIAQQKLDQAKNAYEYSLKRSGGVNVLELSHREQALAKYKKLYKKAQDYAELAKKLYQKIHGEMERMVWMSDRFRDNLEKSRDDGMNFLNKAISTLDSYTQ